MGEEVAGQLAVGVDDALHAKDEAGLSDEKLNIFFSKSTKQTNVDICLLYTSPSPRDQRGSRMPSSA